MDGKKKEFEAADFLGGTLQILGLKIDLGELLTSPEKLKGHLEELRERLKQAGGKETLSDEEWRRGGTSVTGYIRTRDLAGEREFHIGTLGKTPRKVAPEQPEAAPPETAEPPVDVFDEGSEITIVADVPGVGLEDLELKVEGQAFSLSTKATAGRSYRKELRLKDAPDPDSLQATCRNGVLEVRLRKRGQRGRRAD